jgi:hypothetical protein
LEASTLFDMEPVPLPEPERLTDGQRRIRRQAALLASRMHPLGAPLRLHREAAPAADKDAPGRRCGNCVFRQLVNGGNRDYPKCLFPSPITGAPVRATHGGASDVRAWWPACTDHQYPEAAA